MDWTDWWLWVVIGLVIAIFEVLAPGFVFLGFAAGAIGVGLLLLIGVPTGGFYGALLIGAVLSAAAWFALRHFVGVRRGQTKFIDDDIND
jgi:membrane protein implicated in regulation of membrane protease activity